MKPYLKYVLIIAILILAHLLVIKPITSLFSKKQVHHVEATVIQEKVENVLKMVNVEGTYSEILDFKDYQYMNLPGFRKKALLKTVSTAAAGIDLEKLKIEFDETRKEVIIENLPEFEILYISSKYTYYDLSEGIFNNFSEKELNKINKTADSIMLDKIHRSDLLNKAKNQGNELLEIVEAMCRANGWQLIVQEEHPIKIIEKVEE